MKAVKMISLALVGAMLSLWNDLVFAQDATTTAATTAFNNQATWLLSMIEGPFSKILGIIILLIGIWQLVNQKICLAMGCFVGFLILVYLPNLISCFQPATAQ